MHREKKQHGVYGFPFEIYNNSCVNGLYLYTHYHREFEIIYIWSGNGNAYVDDQCYSVSAGDVLFVASEQLHGMVKTSDEPGAFSSFVFAPEFLGNADTIADKYVTPILNGSLHIPTLIKNNHELSACLSQLAAPTNNRCFELKAKYYMFRIWDILISLSESCPAKANRIKLNEIKTAIDYIKSGYSQKITLPQLAESANMSKEYFCRIFRDITGISPIHYLTQIRIEKSCLLLKDTDVGIGEISMKCGFSSFSYFSEMFKRYMGCTPKEYRQKHTAYGSQQNKPI